MGGGKGGMVLGTHGRASTSTQPAVGSKKHTQPYNYIMKTGTLYLRSFAKGLFSVSGFDLSISIDWKGSGRKGKIRCGLTQILDHMN